MPLLSSVRMLRFTLMAALFASSFAVHAADSALRADLERIAHERVYFGHQSVGANLLEGVKQLADGAGVPLRIVESPRRETSGRLSEFRNRSSG